MTGHERGNGASRRTVLKAAAATGALAGIGEAVGIGAAQPAEITLDGDTSGWVGRSPESIAGRTNPTLALEPGRTYRVTWTNVDGAPHSFVVTDAQGTRLASTDIADEEGASRTVEFEARAEMTTYFCEVHPVSMRGRVSVGGAETNAGTTRTTGATQETTVNRPPVLDATTVVLGGQASHWLGLAPSGIQGRENPTLRLRPGAEYELVWMNLDGMEHDFHLVDGGGEDLADTSSRDGVGETHDTSFEATAEMAQYYCEFHPQSMRGSIEVV